MKKKEKDCNCHQKADGIDTDVLKHLDTASVKKLQKAIGTVPDGKYKDSDKTALKKKAGTANIRLRDWLMKNSGIFAEITKAESLMMAGNEKPTIRI